MKRAVRILIFWIGMGFATSAGAVDCVERSSRGKSYSVCTVDVTREKLRLFLKDDKGAPFGGFTAVDAALGGADARLAFGMNAGMYHQDRSPVGYYLEQGVEEMRVVPNAGPGNFGLLPNGVFCIAKARVYVVETLRFMAEEPRCEYATQSGPMLVIDGDLHPKFLVSGTSRYIRNGVGVRANGTQAIFVISNDRVTFYEFGNFFRDVLATPNALYFDGNVSRLYAPEIGRADLGRPMGPIVGVVEAQP